MLNVKCNNFGYTFIELLATITILGILSTFAIISYTSYKNKSIEDNYNILFENIAIAADNYFMDNSGTLGITINELINNGYLKEVKDPSDTTKSCSGTVSKVNDKYTVKLNCSGVERIKTIE